LIIKACNGDNTKYATMAEMSLDELELMVMINNASTLRAIDENKKDE